VVQRSGPVQVAAAGDGSEYEVALDGWALKTVAITRAAHAEHTVAITRDGPRILTVP
jgi:methionyl aminopeptidase